MPIPTDGVIFGAIQSRFPQGTTPGDDVKLAKAVADVLGEACLTFAQRVKMAPQLKLTLPVDFAQIVAGAVEATLNQFSSLAVIAPGIPVAGQVTVGAGDLI